ncbi:hypothetical protein [Acetobacter sp.]|uniref:hypothetical protein n=1 Tax=Acetobacter sp. TaxID=440 RepID=UPI0039E866CF
MTTNTRYIVYLTQPTALAAPGTVVNIVMWDGVANWSPDTGSAIAADPDGTYSIGSFYSPSSATP